MAQVLGQKAIQQLREVVRRVLHEDRNGRPTGATNKFNGVQPMWLAKTTTDHNVGASKTVDLYAGATAGSESATGETIPNVYNRIADVAEGTWCYIGHISGRFEIVQSICASTT